MIFYNCTACDSVLCSSVGDLSMLRYVRGAVHVHDSNRKIVGLYIEVVRFGKWMLCAVGLLFYNVCDAVISLALIPEITGNFKSNLSIIRLRLSFYVMLVSFTGRTINNLEIGTVSELICTRREVNVEKLS